MEKFNTSRGQKLIIDKYEFDQKNLKADFYYLLDEDIFKETIKFQIPFEIKNYDKNKIEKALFNAHIALATSYWKLKAPNQIIIKSGKINQAEKEKWTKLWKKGLGEYFYLNKIDFRNLINFENEKGSIPDQKKENTVTLNKNFDHNKNLLCLGGGKDSLLSAQLLLKNKIPFTPLIFGNNELAFKQALKMNLKPIIIERRLDKKLLQLNQTGKYFNGHVPFSLILSSVANLAAILTNHNNIIVSNEHSANFANVEYLGMQTNHQWSKSFEAEKIINEILNKNEVNYYSLLRPFWELKIVESFLKNRDQIDFLMDFASCNKNFTQKESVNKNKKRPWCASCPKCAFAFALFSAFLPRKELSEIFGENLFKNEKLLVTFQELWGEIGIKPFECVGEPGEVIAALTLALQIEKARKDEIILEKFQKKFMPSEAEKNKLFKGAQKLLNFYGENNIPVKIEKTLFENS